MHRTIHLAEYIFFSSAHGTFSRIDYILGHNTSFIKFKKAEIISSMFFHHKAMRVEINYKAKSFKKNINIIKTRIFVFFFYYLRGTIQELSLLNIPDNVTPL